LPGDGSGTREPLDDQLAAVIDDVAAMGVPEWHRLSVPAARRLEDDLFTPEDPPPVSVVRDFGSDGPAGEVPVRVYRDVQRPAPVGVCDHGGGWTLGTLDSGGV
jgi:acetyl esterase